MISLLVPTRGRPENVRRLVTSARVTAVNDVELIFYVDDDDVTSFEVVDDYADQTIIGPRVVLSEMWNRCAELANHDVMMHCGDDIIFRTSGWDDRILEAFDRYPDKIVFVHGEDGIQGAQIGTHGFLHRNWIDTVGYFVPPYFSSDYNDLWLSEVADALGRRVYLPSVYTEHMHPVAGKAPLDQTHLDRLARHQRDNVGQLYANLAYRRHEDVEKLRMFIDTFNP